MNKNKKSFIFKLIILCIIFMSSSITILADNVEKKEEVHKSKVWKFTFNEKIDLKDINKNSIFVKNREEKNIEVGFQLQADKRTLLINPPIGGYKSGEQYTLFLNTDIGTNDKITNYLTIDFVIEKEEIKKVNTVNNILDKEITFDKKTFSVKDHDWLCEDIEYDISLQNVLSGEEAWEIIKQSNRFNSEPAKDKEYILAKFNIKLKKTERNRHVNFNKKMFKIISENNKVYNPYECNIVLDEELDDKLTEGEECSGWIAGCVDKTDRPLIVINKGKDSEVSFKIKKNDQRRKEENDVEKEDREDKENKENKENKEEKENKKEILTKDQLLKYLEKNKDIMDNKEFQRIILNNYLESNMKTQKNNILLDLKDNDLLNNNYKNSNNDFMMRYLYYMLNEKTSN